MRLDKLKPAWVRAGLILATILVFAWHVQAGFDPTLGAIAFALALGLVTFESGRQRATAPSGAPSGGEATEGSLNYPTTWCQETRGGRSSRHVEDTVAVLRDAGDELADELRTNGAAWASLRGLCLLHGAEAAVAWLHAPGRNKPLTCFRRSRACCGAEDGGFEPPRALTQHAFQACAIGH
jgi:hypothetical protein